jgi:tRNA(Ile)-lysidine synthetase-like protein
MCLALAISEIRGAKGWGLSLAHVDHGLRPESKREQRQVREWAKSLNLSFVGTRVQVGRKGGVEGAARAARYAALERIADRAAADWIATAHTATDQAETVLLRLGQGAGLRGARGIHEVRGRVLRPLLNVTRPEVDDFLAARGVTPLVEDPSNEDLTRARNRLRHRVIPELRLALGAGAERALVRFARHAWDDEEALTALDVLPNPASRDLLSHQPRAVQRRWVRRWGEALGYVLNSAELEAATESFGAGRRSGVIEIGRRLDLVVSKDEVGLGPTLHASSSAGPARKGAVASRAGYVPDDGDTQ